MACVGSRVRRRGSGYREEVMMSRECSGEAVECPAGVGVVRVLPECF